MSKPLKKAGERATAQPKERADLLARARAAAAAITDDEDARIVAAAMTDPDNLPNRSFRRRGRPPATVKKESVLLRLDPEVIAHFKAGGEGWQTRINAALRKAAGLN